MTFDGVGERTIEIPVPGDRVPTGFRIRERAPSEGIDRTLEQLLGDGESSTPVRRFHLVPGQEQSP